MTLTLKGIARRSQKRAAMESLTHSAVTQTAGVAGDSRGKPSKRQITVLSEKSWQTIAFHHGKPIDWLIRRANVLISGIEFNESDIGSTLTIGQAVLEITTECDPCYRMDEQVKGLQALLTPAFTAGVCCKVIHDGYIKVGDTVKLMKPQQQPKLI
jgi:MOSC domain-containing protein YiiM